ncbi:MAG: lipid II:glycine glycyltransferase FemX [Acidobacteriota bacterium]
MHVVNELNRATWNDFVEKHPDANVFHTPEMFEVFRRARGFAPSLWAVMGDKAQVLALLLPVRVTILGAGLQPFTTRAVVYGSVLSAAGEEGREALALLLRTYRQRMKGRLLFTELRHLCEMGESGRILNEQGFEHEEHLNFLIDLNQPLQQIWRNIRDTGRHSISKARYSGVAVEEVTTPDELAAAYSILKDVYRRVQVPLADRSLFDAALQVLRPKGMLRLVVASVDGQRIGTLVLLLYKGVVYEWYTGALREFAKYQTGEFLVWHALEWGSQNGFQTFDFGGAGRPDEEYGVRDFKAKFGGQLVNFGRNRCVHAPLRLRLSQGGYQLLRRFL